MKRHGHWFEIWGEEEAQNRLLKGILVFFVCVCLIESVALCALSLRSPSLVLISKDETRWTEGETPTIEILKAEAHRAVSRYLLARHTWASEEVEEKIAGAGKLVAEGFLEDFKKATQTQVRLAKEKRISQKLFVTDLVVKWEERVAEVSGERVLVVDGLRAATPMTLKVHFTLGSRTQANPEGVFITAEELVSESSTTK